jgi:tRNA(adenine34) deaminase
MLASILRKNNIARAFGRIAAHMTGHPHGGTLGHSGRMGATLDMRATRGRAWCDSKGWDGGQASVLAFANHHHSHRASSSVMAEADDIHFMKRALEEAGQAAAKGEVPVGCVLVDASGREVAAAHNERETAGDPTAHAEMLAIRRAALAAGGWRLEGVTAYVTLEPCAMCAGALVHARVSRVVYGCGDPKGGAIDTLFGIGRDPRLNHRFDVMAGVLGDECSTSLREFFVALRERRVATPPRVGR